MMAMASFWWIDNWALITMPVHDPPAVWKSWGLRGGCLPVVESLRGAPVSPPRYGFSPEDGLPTLHAMHPTQERQEG